MTEEKELDAILAADNPTPDESPPAPADEKKPAAPEKIRGRLVPNRHDRRRSAAIARRNKRRKP